MAIRWSFRRLSPGARALTCEAGSYDEQRDRSGFAADIRADGGSCDSRGRAAWRDERCGLRRHPRRRDRVRRPRNRRRDERHGSGRRCGSRGARRSPAGSAGAVPRGTVEDRRLEPGDRREVQGHRRQVLHRLRLLREGPRDRRELRDPRVGTRVQAEAPRSRRRCRETHLHREACGRRLGRHSIRARHVRRRDEEGTGHRRRHAAAPPVGVRAGDEADRRRGDWRGAQRPGVLEPGAVVEPGASALVDRHRMADSQLAVFHLALRRPHRRTARPQHRRRELGLQRTSDQKR